MNNKKCLIEIVLEQMIKNRIDVVTLGCSKNLVDSEMLMRQLLANGYTIEHDSDNPQGEIAVINTCGFIGDAKEESINMILSFAEQKKHNKLKKLFVMGCLSERYMAELSEEIPEVDKFYGKFAWRNLISDLGKSYNQELSYCSIPLITGKYKSRPMEEIEEEVRNLVQKGVKEFQFIAQDLTYYGLDIYKEMKIAELVKRISAISGVEWIRLHYAYPAHFPMDLLPVIRECDNVCKYLDIALQHISDDMLRNMRRNITKEETINLIQTIRNEVPGIHLRTTLMVGHPSETNEDFNELLDFVQEARFERLGAFPYSHEEDTYCDKNYTDDIAPEIKEERLNKLMELQEEVALSINELKIGQTLRVIIDSETPDYYIARTEFDSPDVDGEVLISKERTLELGSFYSALITSALPFDLMATIV